MEAQAPAKPSTQRCRRNSALQSHSPAYERAAPQRETPGIMEGERDTNALVGHHIRRRLCVASKAMSRIGAQIQFMMAISDATGLREFAGSRAKTCHVVKATTFLHSFDPFPRR